MAAASNREGLRRPRPSSSPLKLQYAGQCVLSKKTMRGRFLLALGQNLRVVWPILSGILAWQLALGFLIVRLEHWSLGDGFYFTFVTGLTIGYGDLVPRRDLSRLLAILIGVLGTVLTGLIVAIAVRALQTAADER